MHERQSFQFILRHALFSTLGEQMHIKKIQIPLFGPSKTSYFFCLNSHSEYWFYLVAYINHACNKTTKVYTKCFWIQNMTKILISSSWNSLRLSASTTLASIPKKQPSKPRLYDNSASTNSASYDYNLDSSTQMKALMFASFLLFSFVPMKTY